MLVGDIRDVVLTEKAANAVAFSAASVVIAPPIGANGGGSLTDSNVDPDFGTPGTNFTFNFPAYSFADAGYYEAVWTLTLADGQALTRIQRLYAFQTDVYGRVRDILKKPTTVVTDAMVDSEAAFVIDELIRKWPCLESYNALAPSDRKLMDEAVEYVLAGRILPRITTGGLGGEIQSWKQGTLAVQYQPGDATTGERGQFVRRSIEALSRVSCIRALLETDRADFRVFTVNGPTRQSAMMGYKPSMMSTLAALLDADFQFASGTV